MYTVTVYFLLFFTFIVASAYLAYKLYQENMWRERWVQVGWVACGMLGFLLFLIRFLSKNIVNMTLGLAMTFANTSLFFSYRIKSELGVKRFLEAFFGAVSVGIILYGYIITGNLILGIVTLFIVAVMLITFISLAQNPRLTYI